MAARQHGPLVVEPAVESLAIDMHPQRNVGQLNHGAIRVGRSQFVQIQYMACSAVRFLVKVVGHRAADRPHMHEGTQLVSVRIPREQGAPVLAVGVRSDEAWQQHSHERTAFAGIPPCGKRIGWRHSPPPARVIMQPKLRRGPRPHGQPANQVRVEPERLEPRWQGCRGLAQLVGREPELPARLELLQLVWQPVQSVVVDK
mmetsp:Transcript_37770/g.120067  ORF Transcript_37770/g.120067 Transcript_37770/m.120067 type:complete len:201 (+) Transcript_37770:486-1088(+)